MPHNEFPHDTKHPYITCSPDRLNEAVRFRAHLEVLTNIVGIYISSTVKNLHMVGVF